MNLVDQLTHDDLGVIAAKKLKSMGYIATFSNMAGAGHGEQPDAMGVKSCGETFLVEAKVSRSDFLSDKNKPWRQDMTAIGNYRAYITPKGLLKPDDVPYGWQLWEVHGKNKPIIKIIKGIVRVKNTHPVYSWEKYINEYQNCDADEYRHFANHNSYRCVAGWLATVCSRISEAGFDVSRYGNKGGVGFGSIKSDSQPTEQED